MRKIVTKYLTTTNDTISIIKFCQGDNDNLNIYCEIQEVPIKAATRKGSINDIVFPFEIRRKMNWNEEIKIILYQCEYLCSFLLVFHVYLCEFHFQYF